MIKPNLAATKTIWYRIIYIKNTKYWVTPEMYKHNEYLEQEEIKHSIQWLDNSSYLLKEWMNDGNRYGFGED